MTDLERALPELDSKWDYQGDDPIWTILFRWCKRGDNDVVRLFMRSDGPIHPLAQALTEAFAAARREGAELADWQRKLEREAGAEEMREWAAQTADEFTCGVCGMDGKCAAAIRALPLTPEEPA